MLRLSRGYSDQRALGKAMGKAAGWNRNLSRYETETGYPPIAALDEILDFLQVTPEEFARAIKAAQSEMPILAFVAEESDAVSEELTGQASVEELQERLKILEERIEQMSG